MGKDTNSSILRDINGNPIVVDDGSAPGGNSGALVSGFDGTNARRLLTATDGSVRNAASPHRQTIHNNATVTTSGNTVVSGLGWSEWWLVINLKNTPTGTTPTIQFKIEQLDPIDQTTVIDSTTTVTGSSHTTSGTEKLQVTDILSDTIKISWTVTGTTPSWTGVNVTFVGHASGNNVKGSTAGFKYGFAATAATTIVPLNATTYTEQTTNAQRSVKSASANDVNLTGTGAWQIIITYYDQNLNGPFTETVNLNGLTAVNTVNTNICFIENIMVITAGSTNQNAGIITLFTTTGGGGTAIVTVAAGANQTFMAHHYIASGKTLNINAIVVGAKSTIAGGILGKFLNPTQASSAEVQVTETLRTANNVSTPRNYGSPIQISGPGRFRLYVTPDANTASTFHGSFDYYEQ